MKDQNQGGTTGQGSDTGSSLIKQQIDPGEYDIYQLDAFKVYQHVGHLFVTAPDTNDHTGFKQGTYVEEHWILFTKVPIGSSDIPYASPPSGKNLSAETLFVGTGGAKPVFGSASNSVASWLDGLAPGYGCDYKVVTGGSVAVLPSLQARTPAGPSGRA